ncbi:TolC family protein [Lacrimispora celerecrescens]|uniref:Outer membrane efflux protein n=1 Tax=[Clostridium] celerecrescens 18A TaxID=1286362 RepID=A0A2M8Z8I3_9FIRM|nr:TolC family protein [Lacrimispora celerecrescens]PJJ29746.1 outer membrane efflux protein [[Clostridium] celerecrescens 18A]
MRKKGYLSACMAVTLTLTAALPVYGAAGPGSTSITIPDGMGEETWNRLNDQTIEFDELSDLVRYFNPDVQNIADSAGNELSNQQYVYDEMRRYIRDLNDDAQAMKDSGATGSEEGMMVYLTLKGTAKALGGNAEKMNNGIKRIDSGIRKNVDRYSRTFSSAADQIMIGYNSALANRAVVQKALDLSISGYEAQSISFKQGLATEADVLEANKGVLAAQAALDQLDNTIDGLKRSLCLMTGYPADGSVQIGEIPQLDLSVIGALDLTADTAKAIGNNYDLIEKRHGGSNKTTTGIKNKDAGISEAEQNLTVTMQSYYQEILQSKSTYDAASTAYEKAVLEKQKADRSYQLGMLSKINYLQAQMAFSQAEGEKQTAYNTLYQAYSTYQWAVNGIVTASEQ